MEYCENNEQHSFHLTLAKDNNLSKLTLMKAIKEETCEQALAKETDFEIVTDCCPVAANLCDTEGSDTTTPTKNDCRAFVPRCKPFRQWIGAFQMANKAYIYTYTPQEN